MRESFALIPFFAILAAYAHEIWRTVPLSRGNTVNPVNSVNPV